jgi:hypothetical protein
VARIPVGDVSASANVASPIATSDGTKLALNSRPPRAPKRHVEAISPQRAVRAEAHRGVIRFSLRLAQTPPAATDRCLLDRYAHFGQGLQFLFQVGHLVAQARCVLETQLR